MQVSFPLYRGICIPTWQQSGTYSVTLAALKSMTRKPIMVSSAYLTCSSVIPSKQAALPLWSSPTTVLTSNRKYMKNNCTTQSFCTADCCSWFYHLPIWYKCLCNLRREFVCRALQSMMHCSERRGQEVGNATHWVTADSNWRTWLLAGATRGWAGWWQYAKFSPNGITEIKRRTASYSWSVLLSYKLICMWAFSSPSNRKLYISLGAEHKI